jgi:hypothetical protein
MIWGGKKNRTVEIVGCLQRLYNPILRIDIECMGLLSYNPATLSFSHIFAIFGACLAKLVSSGDDIVWLLPFLVHGRSSRVVSALLYIAALECIVALSWVIAVAGSSGLQLWLTDAAASRVLHGTSALLLASYASVLWRRTTVVAKDAAPSHRSMFVIALLGSVDELSYFPGLQWSGLFSVDDLAVGTALAGFIVIGACLGAGRLHGLAKRIEMIPLWLIVAVFAVLSLVQAFG